jgi:hypothetical protein
MIIVLFLVLNRVIFYDPDCKILSESDYGPETVNVQQNWCSKGIPFTSNTPDVTVKATNYIKMTLKKVPVMNLDIQELC